MSPGRKMDGDMRPAREWLGKLGLLLLGTVLALLAAELALRGAALVAGSSRTPGQGSVGEGSILTLGDSHTYGIFLESEETYPGQLQELLDGRLPNRFHVVNLGLPGMNSSEIATALPEWYAKYRPHAAVICVGINNVWNRTGQAGRGAPERALASLRLVRLLSILRYNLQGSAPTRQKRFELERTVDDEPAIEHRDAETGRLLVRHVGDPGDRIDLADASAILRRDLIRVAEISRRFGVRLILLTYAATPTPETGDRLRGVATMSEEMAAVSRELGLHLVDVRPAFQRLLAGGAPRERWFLTETDGHPNARGYAVIARRLADAIPAEERSAPPFKALGYLGEKER